MSPSREGVLRVLQDVMVHQSSDEELIAVGRRAGVVGDLLTVELADADGDAASGVGMRVIESRPLIIDGTVRHRLRLAPVTSVQPDRQDSQNRLEETDVCPERR